MGEYRKSIVLGLDYSNFSAGITEAKRKMGLLEAEFKLAAEQAKEFGDDTEQLRIKEELLTQKIHLQNAIVNENAKQYDQLMSSKDRTEKQTDAMDKKLLTERTTLQKLKNELSEVRNKLESTADEMGEFSDETKSANKTTKEAKEGTETFGDAIRDVADSIGLDCNPAIEKLAEKFDGVNRKMGEAVLTAGIVITSLGKFSLETSKSAKEIDVVSQRMGMTTDQYQEWDYVLKLVGTDAESATGDIAALAEKAVEATDKTSDSAKIFRELGVSVMDTSGKMKTQNQLFTEVVHSLQNMDDVTRRNAIASDLLSTTGENLVPVLNMSAKELSGLKKEAHDMGYVMSNEAVKSASDFDNTMGKFDSKVESIKNKLGMLLLPMLENLVDIFLKIPTPVLEAVGVFGAILFVLGKVADTAVILAGKNAILAASNFALGTSGATATAGLAPLLLTILAIAAAIALVVGGAAAISSAMKEVEDAGNTIVNAGQDAANKAKKTQYHAYGTKNFEGGETWVGEHGPEKVILPMNSRIIPSNQLEHTGTIQIYQIENITIPAKEVKEFNDIIKIIGEEQKYIRAGVTRL